MRAGERGRLVAHHARADPLELLTLLEAATIAVLLAK
jgi:hypothetical protein